MKLEEFTRKCQQILAEEGDIEIKIFNNERDRYEDLEFITTEYSSNNYTETPFLLIG